MITVKRSNPENTDFIQLVRLLDADLAERDGEDHNFYAQFNKPESLTNVVVAYQDGIPAGCGAMKPFNTGVMEIKRMFVRPDNRRKGIAAMLLGELEKWAKECSGNRCVLETGLRQPEAIRLYTHNGYQIIPNYGSYEGIENSCCFGKDLE